MSDFDDERSGTDNDAYAAARVTALAQLTVREACRRRVPLQGAEQCLEYALTITERERDDALRRANRAEAEEERLYHELLSVNAGLAQAEQERDSAVSIGSVLVGDYATMARQAIDSARWVEKLERRCVSLERRLRDCRLDVNAKATDAFRGRIAKRAAELARQNAVAARTRAEAAEKDRDDARREVERLDREHMDCGMAIHVLRRERDEARSGKCLDVIPGTFIACGDGGNYCSEACRLRAALAPFAKAAIAHVVRHKHDDLWVSLGVAASAWVEAAKAAKENM